MHGLEVAVPGEQLACVTGPELLGLGDGFLIEGLVLLEAWDCIRNGDGYGGKENYVPLRWGLLGCSGEVSNQLSI